MAISKRLQGDYGEQLAATYLQQKGYQIISRNVVQRRGEIDIVAKHKNTYVFIEVRTKTSEHHGTPEESIGNTKKKRFLNAVSRYIYEHNIEDESIRCDVVAVLLNTEPATIRHYQNAFISE